MFVESKCIESFLNFLYSLDPHKAVEGKSIELFLASGEKVSLEVSGAKKIGARIYLVTDQDQIGKLIQVSC